MQEKKKSRAGSKPGPRPHTWIVQGEIPHQQYCAWLQMKAQANYRKEIFLLTFEDFQTVWMGNWERKGRGRDEYCLTREDPEGAWVLGNVICIQRLYHLRRQRQLGRGLKYGKKEYLGD